MSELQHNAVVFSGGSFHPRRYRERMLQVIMETFNMRGMHIASDAVCSLFSTGRSTGVVLDCGAGVTHTVPIYEGHNLRYAVSGQNLGGNDLTQLIRTELAPFSFRPLQPRTGSDMYPYPHAINNMKESTDLFFVTSNYESEAQTTGIETAYQLPDGQTITLNSERYRYPELLFQPNLNEHTKDKQGVHQLLINSIQSVDESLHAELFANTVISGGSCMFSGMKQRLEMELGKLSDHVVEIIEPTSKLNSAWVGASIIASLAEFNRMMVTYDLYDEYGPMVVNRMI
uniref:Actin n=1 Tax=Vannella robusta TaxID=1487602 RepID=A0A7S4MPG5_9EUKA|mmetsp:Transcript_5885/g.7241  ORF Transcript_5885/g.7241 Transcript_5885/m.7241 type:complete len:286 (+) Transcript_5885:53-910(+)